MKFVSLTSVSKHSQHLGQKESHFFKRVCVKRVCVCVFESAAGGKLQYLSVQLFVQLISVSASAVRQWAGLPR